MKHCGSLASGGTVPQYRNLMGKEIKMTSEKGDVSVILVKHTFPKRSMWSVINLVFGDVIFPKGCEIYDL